MPNRRRLLLSTFSLSTLPLLARAQRAPTVQDPARLLLLDPLPMPGLARSRRLRVYLPPGYARQTERHYPVIYFHDGQNVFDNASSYAGEWGADELLDQLAPQGLEAIAVGIDNGAELRMRELNPWDHERTGKGEGWAYLRFLVDVVKPAIDGRFRTRPEAASTALIGSSMGGLITHAALHRHREVFGLGGVLSPSFWIAPQAFDLARAEPLLASQRVLVYAGGREGESMLPQARRMAELLQTQSPQVRFIEEAQAQHNEAAWRAVLPRVLAHLFQRG